MQNNNGNNHDSTDLQHAQQLLDYLNRANQSNDELVAQTTQNGQERTGLNDLEDAPVSGQDPAQMLNQNATRWEQTHTAVLETIRLYLKQTGRLPTKTEIAEQTGLSRPTVYAHLKQYQGTTEFRNILGSYQFMAPVIIDTILTNALNGDLRAAKIFLDSLNKIDSWKIPIEQYEPAIRIDELEVTQDAIDSLSAETRSFLKAILAEAAFPDAA